MKLINTYISLNEKISSLDNYISLDEKISSLNDYIQERLHITKDTCRDISDQWADVDQATKYEYDAIYYFFELIKDKVLWDHKLESLYNSNFDTTLSADDLEELDKTLGKDNFEHADFYLSAHEWIYDKSSAYPSFRICIHSLPMIKIWKLTHSNKYSMTIANSAQTFYKKYYKDEI